MDFNGILVQIIVLALTVGLVFRQLAKWNRKGDSESTSRTDDASGQEQQALRRDLESTSRANNASGEEYDVFLSFRGSDTRKTFTDCLYHHMVRAGIRVFLDSEELQDGKEISEVLNAVNVSRIYMPIFSQNFASSKWCLREVTRMVEHYSKSNGKKEIIPIFYNMRIDDVKLKTNLYKNAILKHKEKAVSNEVQQWESALKTVGGIKGRELEDKRQGEQIESIVDAVCRKLNTRHMIVTEHLVEDYNQVETIMKLLDVDSGGVRFVGIHGMGGVGKTTLAKVIYNKLCPHFKFCCFLEDVRASSQPHDGLLNLQKKLCLDLSDSSSHEIADQIKDVGSGIKRIKQVLSNKKVLIILDDLHEKEQLKNLAGKSNWFHSGSRIIITTREASILNTEVDQTQGILSHEVLRMRFDLALRLFYKFAFRNDFAVKGYEDPSRKIVRTVGMLPLAVVVIGSHLFDVANDWGNVEAKAIWAETLKMLKEAPFDKVRESLNMSYAQLKDNEKEIFLDIACFFINNDKTYPFMMWEDLGYYPLTTLRVLSLKSLVKIRDDNSFWMHEQVRDFGRYIALEKYPHEFYRVWILEKAIDLLKREEENQDVKALSLMFGDHDFTPNELTCLPNLRFLRVKESNFFGNFENLLSELRWLSWQVRQTTFLANNFHFGKLVVLDLSYSNIEDGWDGWSQMKMNRLKALDLTGCKRLKRTPDLYNFVSLEMLILSWCVMLTTIDSSIGKLVQLKILNIKGCKSLRELPTEIGSLQYLTEIVMPQYTQSLKLPETFGHLKSLSSLILDRNHGISHLPESIGGLVNITRLSLCQCVKITKLPNSIGKLQMLFELDVSWSGLLELPDSIGDLKKLEVIRISYTEIKKFPHTIGQVKMLKELHARQCKNLIHENLEEIEKLSHLRILDLLGNELSTFPPMLSCLSGLQTLQLDSRRLQEVPNLPPNLTCLHLQASHLASILDLSSLISQALIHLRKLKLSNSKFLVEIRGLSLLKNLHCLNLEKLPSLVGIHDLSELESLLDLRISFCNKIESLPNLSKLDKLQRIEVKGCPQITTIEGVEALESCKLSPRGNVLKRSGDGCGSPLKILLLSLFLLRS